MNELLLPPRLVIAEAAALRELFLAYLAGSAGQVRIDGSRVEECDTAGVQLLLATARTVSASRRSLRIVRCSVVLRRTLELASVINRFGIPDQPDHEGTT